MQTCLIPGISLNHEHLFLMEHAQDTLIYKSFSQTAKDTTFPLNFILSFSLLRFNVIQFQPNYFHFQVENMQNGYFPCKINTWTQNSPHTPFLQNSKYPDKTSESNLNKARYLCLQISFAFPLQVSPHFWLSHLYSRGRSQTARICDTEHDHITES